MSGSAFKAGFGYIVGLPVAAYLMHFGERRGNTNKRIRETEAESVAYVVCSAIGLETGTAAQDYLGLYGGDSKLLLESLEYVQATASHILDAIEERLQQQAA